MCIIGIAGEYNKFRVRPVFVIHSWKVYQIFQDNKEDDLSDKPDSNDSNDNNDNNNPAKNPNTPDPIPIQYPDTNNTTKAQITTDLLSTR